MASPATTMLQAACCVAGTGSVRTRCAREDSGACPSLSVCCGASGACFRGGALADRVREQKHPCPFWRALKARSSRSLQQPQGWVYESLVFAKRLLRTSTRALQQLRRFSCQVTTGVNGWALQQRAWTCSSTTQHSQPQGGAAATQTLTPPRRPARPRSGFMLEPPPCTKQGAKEGARRMARRTSRHRLENDIACTACTADTQGSEARGRKLLGPVGTPGALLRPV